MNRITARLIPGLLLLFLTVAGPGATLARAAAANAAGAQQDSPAADSMQSDRGLDPVEARRLRFLFWGYAVIWILLAAYLVSIAVRLRGVRQELARMRGRIGPGGKG